MLEIMAYLCSVLLSPVFWTGIFSNVKHLLLISFRPRERERSTSLGRCARTAFPLRCGSVSVTV